MAKSPSRRPKTSERKKVSLEAAVDSAGNSNVIDVGSSPEGMNSEIEITLEEDNAKGENAEKKSPALSAASESLDPRIFKTPHSDYEILDRLGAGGMGEVFKVRHSTSGKIMALKLLHGKFSDDKQLLKRFEQEAETASLLSHENLASVYEGGISVDGEPYLLMDYIEGETLAELIKRESSIGQDRFLKIFIQVCDGLIHAHQKRLLHRDLKPANIMRFGSESSDDFIKLVDFGIAKVLPSGSTDEQRVTQTGEVLGSPVYMSPEQCLGHALDERSDIYSLGCVMYEALTGRPPFLGDNVVQTIFSHLNDKPAPFSKLKNISPDLEALVFQCLEKKPEDRLQSMSELKATLELLQDPDDKEKQHILQVKRYRTNASRFIRKHRSRIVVASICLLALMVAGSYNISVWEDENRLQGYINQAQIFEEQAKNTGYDSLERKLVGKQAAVEWHRAIDLALKMKKSDRVIANLYVRLSSYEDDRSKRIDNLKTAISYYDHDGKCFPELLAALEDLTRLLDHNNKRYDLVLELASLAPDLEDAYTKASTAKDYDTMVKISKSQLKVQPHSTLALDRLEDAYHNLGLYGPPKDRLKNLEKACFIGSPTSDYRHALNEELTKLGINPNSTTERIRLAKKAENENAFDRAAVEYAAALRIENSQIMELMLEECHSIVAKQNVQNGEGYLNRTAFEVIPLYRRQLELTGKIFKGKAAIKNLKCLAERSIDAGSLSRAAQYFERLQDKKQLLDLRWNPDERDELLLLAQYGNLQFQRGLLEKARSVYKRVLSPNSVNKLQFFEAESTFEYYFEVLEALNLKNELASEKARLEAYKRKTDLFFRQGDAFGSEAVGPGVDVNLP